MDERNERGIRTPLDLLREVKAIDTEEAHRFVDVMRAFRPRIIVNDVRSAEDIRLGFSVRSVCRKYFAIDAEYLGYVNHDAAARASVRARRPLVDSRPALGRGGLPRAHRAQADRAADRRGRRQRVPAHEAARRAGLLRDPRRRAQRGLRGDRARLPPRLRHLLRRLARRLSRVRGRRRRAAARADRDRVPDPRRSRDAPRLRPRALGAGVRARAVRPRGAVRGARGAARRGAARGARARSARRARRARGERRASGRARGCGARACARASSSTTSRRSRR